MLSFLNFVLILLALYVNFSLNWEKLFEISTEGLKKVLPKHLNFNNLKSSGKTVAKHTRIAI